MTEEETRHYIATMSVELHAIAQRNGLRTLAELLSMVVLESGGQELLQREAIAGRPPTNH